MNQARIRARAAETLAARLNDGERVLDACFVWAALRRPKVSRLVQNRQPAWLVLTEERVLIVPRPRRRHKPGRALFDAPYSRTEIVGRRRHGLLRQWDLRGDDDRTLVVELRPGTRRVVERVERETHAAHPPGASRPRAGAAAGGGARPRPSSS